MTVSLTDLLAAVVFVPVLTVVDVVQIPTGRENHPQSGLRDAIDVVTVSAPDLNDRVRFQLRTKSNDIFRDITFLKLFNISKHYQHFLFSVSK